MTDPRRASARTRSAILAATSAALVGLVLFGATARSLRPARVVGPRRVASCGQALWRAPEAPANEWGLHPAVTSPTHLTRVERGGDPPAARPAVPLLALAPAALGLESPAAVELLRARLRARAPRAAAPRVASARAPPR